MLRMFLRLKKATTKINFLKVKQSDNQRNFEVHCNYFNADIISYILKVLGYHHHHHYPHGLTSTTLGRLLRVPGYWFDNN